MFELKTYFKDVVMVRSGSQQLGSEFWNSLPFLFSLIIYVLIIIFSWKINDKYFN